MSDGEKQGEGINCLLFEARNNITVQKAEERTFKDTIRKINPKMRLVRVSSRHGELVGTKYGKILVCYQLTHTETNFDVAINIDSVARHETQIKKIKYFPRLPLQHQGESEKRCRSNEKNDFVRKLFWMQLRDFI